MGKWTKIENLLQLIYFAVYKYFGTSIITLIKFTPT